MFVEERLRCEEVGGNFNLNLAHRCIDFIALVWNIM